MARNGKKFLAVLLALVMVVALGTVAFAATAPDDVVESTETPVVEEPTTDFRDVVFAVTTAGVVGESNNGGNTTKWVGSSYATTVDVAQHQELQRNENNHRYNNTYFLIAGSDATIATAAGTDASVRQSISGIDDSLILKNLGNVDNDNNTVDSINVLKSKGSSETYTEEISNITSNPEQYGFICYIVKDMDGTLHVDGVVYHKHGFVIDSKVSDIEGNEDNFISFVEISDISVSGVQNFLKSKIFTDISTNYYDRVSENTDNNSWQQGKSFLTLDQPYYLGLKLNGKDYGVQTNATSYASDSSAQSLAEELASDKNPTLNYEFYELVNADVRVVVDGKVVDKEEAAKILVDPVSVLDASAKQLYIPLENDTSKITIPAESSIKVADGYTFKGYELNGTEYSVNEDKVISVGDWKEWAVVNGEPVQYDTSNRANGVSYHFDIIVTAPEQESFGGFVPSVNTQTPVEEIPDEDVPQADVPEDPSEPAGEETIVEENPALADAPAAVTGDGTIIWFVVMFASCIVLTVVITDKKSKNN